MSSKIVCTLLLYLFLYFHNPVFNYIKKYYIYVHWHHYTAVSLFSFQVPLWFHFWSCWFLKESHFCILSLPLVNVWEEAVLGCGQPFILIWLGLVSNILHNVCYNYRKGALKDCYGNMYFQVLHPCVYLWQSASTTPLSLPGFFGTFSTHFKSLYLGATVPWMPI